MTAEQFQKIARKTAAKIFKTGYFYDLNIDSVNRQIRFNDVHGNLYAWQTHPMDKIGGMFTIGKVQNWTDFGPTFESEYNTYGPIARSHYMINFMQHTDNPDFILRTSLAYLLPTR